MQGERAVEADLIARGYDVFPHFPLMLAYTVSKIESNSGLGDRETRMNQVVAPCTYEHGRLDNKQAIPVSHGGRRIQVRCRNVLCEWFGDEPAFVEHHGSCMFGLIPCSLCGETIHRCTQESHAETCRMAATWTIAVKKHEPQRAAAAVRAHGVWLLSFEGREIKCGPLSPAAEADEAWLANYFANALCAPLPNLRLTIDRFHRRATATTTPTAAAPATAGTAALEASRGVKDTHTTTHERPTVRLAYGLMREAFSGPFVPIDRHGWQTMAQAPLPATATAVAAPSDGGGRWFVVPPSDVRSYALSGLSFRALLKRGTVGSLYYHESHIVHFIVAQDSFNNEPLSYVKVGDYVSKHEAKQSGPWDVCTEEILTQYSTQHATQSIPQHEIAKQPCRIYLGVWLEAPNLFPEHRRS